MSGSLLIKLSIEPTSCPIETLIAGVLGGSLSFYHAEVCKSRIQCIVLETEVPCAHELEAEFAAHEWTCSLITRAIHDVAPGALRLCSAIWLDDDDWFFPVKSTNEETAA